MLPNVVSPDSAVVPVSNVAAPAAHANTRLPSPSFFIKKLLSSFAFFLRCSAQLQGNFQKCAVMPEEYSIILHKKNQQFFIFIPKFYENRTKLTLRF